MLGILMPGHVGSMVRTWLGRLAANVLMVVLLAIAAAGAQAQGAADVATLKLCSIEPNLI
ncbi:MAG: hypothetical protein ACLP02_18750 [Rhodomicrobium sp.]